MIHLDVRYQGSWVFIQCVEHPEVNLQLPYDPKTDGLLPDGAGNTIIEEMVEFGVWQEGTEFEVNYVNQPPQPEPEEEPDKSTNVPVEIFKAVEE
jgi:hypothetical protein